MLCLPFLRLVLITIYLLLHVCIGLHKNPSDNMCFPNFCWLNNSHVVCTHAFWACHVLLFWVTRRTGTSLTLAPSGRHVVAGFTDGTIRLFDLTGRLWSPSRSASGRHGDAANFYDQDSDDDSDDDQDGATSHRRHRPSGSGVAVDDDMRDLFDHDSDDDDADDGAFERGGRTGTSSSAGTSAPPSASRGRVASVCSKSNAQFGAVAAQIHAKGVITSLLMDVSIAQDGLYAFGGVLRGSMELVAIDLGKVEAYHDMITAQSGGRETRDGSDSAAITGAGGSGSSGVDILDLVSVYRHSDAKLKGFGACTRVRKDGEVEYRLFTGKGIKVCCY